MSRKWIVYCTSTLSSSSLTLDSAPAAVCCFFDWWFHLVLLSSVLVYNMYSINKHLKATQIISNTQKLCSLYTIVITFLSHLLCRPVGLCHTVILFFSGYQKGVRGLVGRYSEGSPHYTTHRAISTIVDEVNVSQYTERWELPASCWNTNVLSEMSITFSKVCKWRKWLNISHGRCRTVA